MGAAALISAGCGDPTEAGLAERTACAPRPPGTGAIAVHYGMANELDPAPAFMNALATDAETVIVTRSLQAECDGGQFSQWRERGDRFRWAFKLTDDKARQWLQDGVFVDEVRAKIDAGWDYVAIDELGANPNAAVRWTNDSPLAGQLATAAQALSADGYGRRLMPYFASSSVSNAGRPPKLSKILSRVATDFRIGMVELYRTTSDDHSFAQQRAYFDGRMRFIEDTFPGINDHLIPVLAVSNKDGLGAYRFLDQPARDLNALTRQFAALHQTDAVTRHNPGVGAYTWGGTQDRPAHYTAVELAAHFSTLANWYAARFGVDAPGVPPPDPPAPDECPAPHGARVDGVCVPSCGAAGGNTCHADTGHACDDHGALPAYDCPVCCARPELVTVYRSYHPTQRSHKFGLSPADAAADGYDVEGAVFALMRDEAPGRHALVRCEKANGNFFYGLDDCEGRGASTGILGHLATQATDGARPLYRLYHAGNGAHFYGASAAERDAALELGYTLEGIAGYVW